jgi:DNA primase
MPGIDYAKVRELIGIAQVLDLSGFIAAESSGVQVRGPCPVHRSSSAHAHSRSFSANLEKNTFRCFKCAASGNQLDLWVAISQLTLHEAAADLCNRLGIDPPLVHQW